MTHGKFLSNQDIDICLSYEEIISLGQLAIMDEKIVSKLLEIELKRENGNSLKAIVQKQDFDDLRDGIKVEIAGNELSIKINDKAYWRIRDNLRFGTR
ncbi:MAG TPA: hypothetical protein VJ208_02285, partial [Candidatus Nanoarchaeia archaeon]|nr:hypothetical protein [Candidatus Nanoarchaeia archaeon]